MLGRAGEVLVVSVLHGAAGVGEGEEHLGLALCCAGERELAVGVCARAEPLSVCILQVDVARVVQAVALAEDAVDDAVVPVLHGQLGDRRHGCDLDVPAHDVEVRAEVGRRHRVGAVCLGERNGVVTVGCGDRDELVAFGDCDREAEVMGPEGLLVALGCRLLRVEQAAAGAHSREGVVIVEERHLSDVLGSGFAVDRDRCVGHDHRAAELECVSSLARRHGAFEECARLRDAGVLDAVTGRRIDVGHAGRAARLGGASQVLVVGVLHGAAVVRQREQHASLALGDACESELAVVVSGGAPPLAVCILQVDVSGAGRIRASVFVGDRGVEDAVDDSVVPELHGRLGACGLLAHDDVPLDDVEACRQLSRLHRVDAVGLCHGHLIAAVGRGDRIDSIALSCLDLHADAVSAERLGTAVVGAVQRVEVGAVAADAGCEPLVVVGELDRCVIAADGLAVKRDLCVRADEAGAEVSGLALDGLFGHDCGALEQQLSADARLAVLARRGVDVGHGLRAMLAGHRQVAV